MREFPRTQIEDVSISRMLIGTNWFLGWSHTSAAKDKLIQTSHTPRTIADVLEVFLAAGVDGVVGFAQNEKLYEAVQEAQQRTGKRLIFVSTPYVPIDDTQAAYDEAARILDAEAARGVPICLPHQSSIDPLVDRRTRRIRQMDTYCKMIRDRGMVPGLSTHMPEAPVYADEADLDVGTYIQIYNAAGFLMQIEVDWVHRMIWDCKKPVITIKPMAAGRLHPLVGMAFAWATIRDCDMVTVGTMTPDEARELIDISLSLLDRRTAGFDLQRTRSQASIDGH